MKDMRGKIQKNSLILQSGNWNKLELKWKMSFTWINKRKNASQQRSCAFINSYISAHLNFIWSLNLRTSRNVFCSLVILQNKIILLLSSFSQYIMPNRVAVCDRLMSIWEKQEMEAFPSTAWQDLRNSLRNSVCYKAEDSASPKPGLSTMCILPAAGSKTMVQPCTARGGISWKANTCSVMLTAAQGELKQTGTQLLGRHLWQHQLLGCHCEKAGFTMNYYIFQCF